MIWLIETSHLIQVPAHIEATTAEELRRRVQHFADTARVKPDKPPIGKLIFRYELAKNGDVQVVHASFIGLKGKRKRFMRLRAENGEYDRDAQRRIMRASMQ